MAPRNFMNSSSQLTAKVFAGYDGNTEFKERSGIAGNIAFGAPVPLEMSQLATAADAAGAEPSAPAARTDLRDVQADNTVTNENALEDLGHGPARQEDLTGTRDQSGSVDASSRDVTRADGGAEKLPESAAAFGDIGPAAGGAGQAALHSAPGNKESDTAAAADDGQASALTDQTGNGNAPDSDGNSGSGNGGGNGNSPGGGGSSGGSNPGQGGNSGGGTGGGNNPGQGGNPGGGNSGGGNTGGGNNPGNGSSPYTPASPIVSIHAGAGHSGQPTLLTVDVTADSHAGVTTTVDISGLPPGATLSAGTHNADGSWTLTLGDLAHLTLTPPAGFTGQIDVTATVHSVCGGNESSAGADTLIAVDAAAQAPVLTVSAVAGFENTAVPLSIDAHAAAGDTGAAVAVTITGVPAGATLSAGTHNQDGSWTLSTADLAHLTLTPASGYIGDIHLSVAATASENNTAVTVTATEDVLIKAAAETPSLNVQTSTGLENTAIALGITSAIVNPHGSETLSLQISGVPDGAHLSAGMDQGGGVWLLSANDLTNLTLTPPQDYTGTLALQVTATATDSDGDAAHVTATLNVTASVAAPVLVTTPVSGFENTAVALGIDAHLGSADPGAALSVVITGVPAGATLSAGTHNQDGSWTLSTADLAHLTLTPASGYIGDIHLSIAATASENGTAATVAATEDILIRAAAETPVLNVLGSIGLENTAIALHIDSSIVNPHGSETLSLQISGVPNGALLSAGANQGGGVWSLSASDLTHLTLTPPQNYTGTLALQVTATATDADGDAAHIFANVNVTATAAAPVLVTTPSSGFENTAIVLGLDAHLGSADPGANLSVVITGVPAGATLSAGTHNPDGSWSLAAGDLTGLTLTPGDHYTGDIHLSVTATASENGTSGSINATLDVHVLAAAETPLLTVHDVAGLENTAITLGIASSIANLHGSETLSVQISGVPAGAHLSAGVDAGGGVWSLSTADLVNLTLTPPQNYTGTLALQVTATATDADGDSAHTSTGFNVTATAAPPVLVTAPVTGLENTAISLGIGAHLGLADPGAALTVVITGVPADASLSAGTHNPDGSWTLSASDLSNLTLTPGNHYTGDLHLSVTATASENGTSGSVNAGLDVHVLAAAETPLLTVHDTAGLENTPIALSIGSSIVDLHGSETLTVQVSGVPAGAHLSAGVDAGGGVWSLSAADLTNLTLTPPLNYTGTLALQVTATATDSDGQSAHISANLNVTATAAAPVLVTAPVTGLENTAIVLNIDAHLGLADPGAALAVVITGVPANATLSAGTHNPDGSWTLSGGDLTGLTLTPANHYTGDIHLSVTATASENGTTGSVNAGLDVHVIAAAEIPLLAVHDVAGAENTAIALGIGSSILNLHGSENLSLTIAGVPDGAHLSAGLYAGNGTWSLSAADLTNLTLTPPQNYTGTLSLQVTAIATDADGDTAHISAGLHVDVLATAQTPLLTLQAAAGLEDQPIALHLGAALPLGDLADQLTVTVTGVPTGASLSAGTHNQDGSWTLSTADLTNLTLTPPANSDAGFTLNVAATATAPDHSAITVQGTLAVSIAGVADIPTFTVADATGIAGAQIPLALHAGLTDADGSESLSVLVHGVPAGFALSAGTNNGDNSWTLSASDLAAVKLVTPPAFNGNLTLYASAVSHENNGATAATPDQSFVVHIGSASSGLQIDLGAHAAVGGIGVGVTTQAGVPVELLIPGGGLLAAHGITVGENTAYLLADAPNLLGLPVLGGLTGAIANIQISGMAAGATLSSGTNLGGGVWSLTTAQLNNLYLIPPHGSDTDFTLHVTANLLNGLGSVDLSTTAVHIFGIAELPTLTVSAGAAIENHAIALNIAGALTNTDGTTDLSFAVSGLPQGFTLNHGTDNGNGSWSLHGGDLTGLSLTPSTDYTGTLNLTVSAIATEHDGSQSVNQFALPVTVAAEIQAPVLTLSALHGTQDQPVSLGLDLGLLLPNAGAEHLTGVTIGGLPAGATLTGATDNHDGTWSADIQHLSQVQLTPGSHWNGDATLTVTATASLNDNSASSSATRACRAACRSGRGRADRRGGGRRRHGRP